MIRTFLLLNLVLVLVLLLFVHLSLEAIAGCYAGFLVLLAGTVLVTRMILKRAGYL
jgi:hypothetical protein